MFKMVLGKAKEQEILLLMCADLFRKSNNTQNKSIHASLTIERSLISVNHVKLSRVLRKTGIIEYLIIFI